MKTAIVYYSMSGNTKYAVDKIADGIKASGDADIIKIRPEKAYPDKGFKKFSWGGKSADVGLFLFFQDTHLIISFCTLSLLKCTLTV